MQISNKAEFFRLWKLGVLGNRTQLWDDPREAYQWGLEQAAFHEINPRLPEIGFREIRISAVGGAGKWQKVPWYDVLTTAIEWRKEGRKFICDDGAPDDKRTIQGELCRTYRGLEGYIDTTSKLPMRLAMATDCMKSYLGASVLVLLGTYMDPSSRDDLDALLELYPNATIEFSCFSVNIGVFSNRNTIFWEVRDY